MGWKFTTLKDGAGVASARKGQTRGLTQKVTQRLGEAGSDDGGTHEGEPVRTVARRIERCADGANGGRIIHVAGSE